MIKESEVCPIRIRELHLNDNIADTANLYSNSSFRALNIYISSSKHQKQNN